MPIAALKSMTDEIVHYMTQNKLDELIIELKNIRENKIPEIANRIDEAKQLGDLSENAEYHAAREDMAWTQSRTKDLEVLITNASIIVSGHSDSVTIGSQIKVSKDGKEKEYTIVGAQEADPLAGKISNESPLGSAFLGKKAGETATVEVPAGAQTYTIISIV